MPCFYQGKCKAEVCRCARADIPCEKYCGCARLRWTAVDPGLPPAASTNVAAATGSPDGAGAAREGAGPPSVSDGSHKDNGSSSSASQDDAVSADQARPRPSHGEGTADVEDAAAAHKGVASPIDVDGSEEEEDALAAHKGGISPIYVADSDEEEDAVAAHEGATSPIDVDASGAEVETGAVHQAAPRPIDVDACDEEAEMAAAHQWAPARSDVGDTEKEGDSDGCATPGWTPSSLASVSGWSHLASAPALGSQLCSRRVWCECSAPGRCATVECPCFACDCECDPDACGSCKAHWDPASGVDREQPFSGIGGESEATAPRVGVLAAAELVAGGVRGIRRSRNEQMQVCLRERLVLGRADAHGFGVFAAEWAVNGNFVGEYAGEVVPHEDTHTRGRVYDAFGVSYMSTLTRSVVLNACRVGSRMRYVNHSRVRANLQPKLLSVCRYLRVGLFALREFSPEEELNFDYGYEEDGWRE